MQAWMGMRQLRISCATLGNLLLSMNRHREGVALDENTTKIVCFPITNLQEKCKMKILRQSLASMRALVASVCKSSRACQNKLVSQESSIVSPAATSQDISERGKTTRVLLQVL